MEIKGDWLLALVGETQLRERMGHGAKWDDDTPRKGWCHTDTGTQRRRPCFTTETYRFECGVSWLYILSPPPSFSSPPSSPPSQPSSPPSLPPPAPPPTLHGLKGTHLYSWIPLEGWRLGLRAVSALKPSWTDNTNSFHFVHLLVLCSCTHLFIQHLPRAYWVPGTMLGTCSWLKHKFQNL